MDAILETLVRLNPWWNHEKFEIGIIRDRYATRINKYIKTGEIVVLSGVRRAGKTTLAYQLIHDLINNQNIDPKQILFVNCDETVLNLTENLLKNVMDAYRQDVCSEQPAYLIFDEIQNIAGWEKWIKSLYDTKKYHIVISGSSSHMLDSNLSHLISGRYLKVDVFPLDFPEYLQFNDLNINKDSISLIANKDRIMNLMRQLSRTADFQGSRLKKTGSLKTST